MLRLSPAWFALLLVGCPADDGLKVYNTDPEARISTPPDGSHYVEGDSILLTGAVSDAQDSPAELTATWTTDADTSWIVTAIPDGSGNVEVSTNSLPPGNWTITLEVVDTAGAVGRDYVGLTIEDLQDEPVVSWVRPTPGETGVEDTPFTFRVQASDAQNGPDDLEVVLSSDEDGEFCVVELDAAGVGDCDAILTVTGHTLTATVTDLDGYVGTDDVYFEVTDGRDVDGDGDSWTPGQGDCNDDDPSIHPGAEEEENGIDDDCDGVADEGTYAYDDDGDCSCESPTCTGSSNDTCTDLAGYDCDDDDDTVYRGAEELCDGIDNDCDLDVDEGTVCVDDDGDGYAEADLDCDDTDASVYPGAPERMDGVDNDCDGAIDEGTAAYDDDGDCYCESDPCMGTSNAACGTATGGDCNDASSAVSPAATEACNGIDDDCDGTTDESGATGETDWYLDLDRDGYGDPSVSVTSCSAPAGYLSNDDDCDDSDAGANPAATETCDGTDEDCDGRVDEAGALGESTWYRDVDRDGYGDAAISVDACTQPSGYVADDSDCADRNASAYPGAEELCNGADDDCDGDVDEGGSLDEAVWYLDADGDGFGDPAIAVSSCTGPTGYVASDDDCDDADGDINPDADEVCDGVDNDCDAATDESGADGEVTWYADVDGDGFGDPATATLACDAPAAWYIVDPDDCDDTDGDVNPDATEVCNGVDDDCDGSTDGTDAADVAVWYVDRDADGYGSTSTYVVSCTAPAGYVSSATDCNDGVASIHPGATEVCDGIDQDCDGTADDGTLSTWYRDSDADGYGSASSTASACTAPSGYVADATDCNDAAAAVHPGADEYCNGADDDCDGSTDENSAVDATTWYRDADADGYGSATSTTVACTAPSGYVVYGTDCDDASRTTYPGAAETCDGADQDCDGSIDEGVTTTYYRDADGDGYGDATVTSDACSRPSGYVTNALDCNDASSAVKPGATETCNGVDDDCDGATDESASDASVWYLDADGDGYGTSSTTSVSCTRPSGYASTGTDCNDGAASINPGAAEVCDGVDQDCDTVIDDGVLITYYRDADGDGYGSASSSTTACSAPSGYVTDNSDCNDGNAAINPTTVWYRDADGDGYGTSSTSTTSCTQPSGYVSTSTDCNDGSSAIRPSATETCNGVDDDCDGSTDEGVTTTYYRDADGDGYGSASTTTTGCSAPSGYVSNSSDCNDSNAAINPATVWYRDADGDGYGTSSYTTASCTQPSGYVSNSTDCNDSSSSVNPSRTESCNGVDDDCDGSTDEQNATGCTTYYYDADNDTYGTSSNACLCATSGSYRATRSGDCQDSNANVNPGQTSYYSSAYSTSSGGTSYDYNCNGSEEERYGGGGICHVDGFGCSRTSGYVYTSSTPGCGSSGGYVTSCTYYVVYCDEVTTSYTQTCR